MDLSPDTVFRLANGVALLGWLALLASPPAARWTGKTWRLTGRALPLAFSLLYVAMLAEVIGNALQVARARDALGQSVEEARRANEELEAAWANKKPAKAALDTAVSRGNAVLAAKPALRKAQPF